MGFFDALIETTLNVATAPVRAAVEVVRLPVELADGDGTVEEEVAASVKRVLSPSKGDPVSFTGTVDK